MTLIGNLFWLLFGGLVMGLGWVFSGILMALTIIGLPWVPAAFRIAQLSFWPFGYTAVPAPPMPNTSTDPLLIAIGNVIWFLLAGWWLAIGHLLSALVCFITILGIPFGIQHLKLAQLSVFPMGTRIERITP